MLKIHKLLFSFTWLLTVAAATAQQTGTVASKKPISAGSAGITVITVVPKPTCDLRPGAAGREIAPVPEMLFSRSWEELVCVRHADGRTELLRTDEPSGIVSSDGSAIAYWNSKKHELHVFLTASRADTLVESLPDARFPHIAWSQKGRLLTYLVAGAKQSAIRSLDLDTGKRQEFSGAFAGIIASPDARHVIAVGIDGVESLAVESGERQKVVNAKYLYSGEYSPAGSYLGLLGNVSLAEQNAPPAAEPAPAEEDDGPDCTGGSFALILQNARTKQLVDVPYPKGFDTVLDFAFSPDESAIAVTFGVVGCDYPGDKARIYLVSLPEMKMTAISSEDRLSVKAVWTPDGKTVVYSDYTGSDSPLVAYEVATRKITRLTNPGQFGPDTWLAWR
jgi:hypothetical protein